MILKAFSLLDTKSGAYATPFFMHHDAQAVRAVTELAQDKSTTVGRYPSDFALVCLGYFDDQAGGLAAEPIRNLGNVAGFLPVNPAPMPLFAGADQPVRLNGAHGPSIGVDANGEVM